MTATTAAPRGFALHSIATRIQGIDSAFTWKVYTALATLARLTGNPKKVVEAKIFGTDKPSKDFANAWSRAGHVYARFYGDVEGKPNPAAQAIRLLGIEDAEKEALRVIDGHMAALEVGGKNAYDLLIEFGSVAEVRAAEAVAAEAAAEEAAEAPAAPEASPTGESEPLPVAEEMPEADVVATLTLHIDTLSNEGLLQVFDYVSQLMAQRAQAAAAPALALAA